MEALLSFFDTATILYLLGSAVLILFVWIVMLELRIKKLFTGKNAKSLEDSISFLIQEHKEMTSFRSELETYLEQVESRLGRSIQSVDTVRFNPFKGSGDGGNQSFASAFLDESGNGIVLSSLYSRDRVSIFAKPIKEHSSSFDLSAEEKEAIQNASARISKK